MTAQDALKLTINSKVWVDYTPSPGHGKRVNSPGVVTASVYGHPQKNIHGLEYVYVTVKIAGDNHSSSYPSQCISKL